MLAGNIVDDGERLGPLLMEIEDPRVLDLLRAYGALPPLPTTSSTLPSTDLDPVDSVMTDEELVILLAGWEAQRKLGDVDSGSEVEDLIPHVASPISSAVNPSPSTVSARLDAASSSPPLLPTTAAELDASEDVLKHEETAILLLELQASRLQHGLGTPSKVRKVILRVPPTPASAAMTTPSVTNTSAASQQVTCGCAKKWCPHALAALLKGLKLLARTSESPMLFGRRVAKTHVLAGIVSMATGVHRGKRFITSHCQTGRHDVKLTPSDRALHYVTASDNLGLPALQGADKALLFELLGLQDASSPPSELLMKSLAKSIKDDERSKASQSSATRSGKRKRGPGGNEEEVGAVESLGVSNEAGYTVEVADLKVKIKKPRL